MYPARCSTRPFERTKPTCCVKPMKPDLLRRQLARPRQASARWSLGTHRRLFTKHAPRRHGDTTRAAAVPPISSTTRGRPAAPRNTNRGTPTKEAPS